MKHHLSILTFLTLTNIIEAYINITDLKLKNCMLDPVQNLNADIIIGAVFPVQQYYPWNRKYIIDPNAVVLVESFQYALASINKNPNILPGIDLGFDIRNNCNDQELTLYHTVDFMIDKRYYDVNMTSSSSDDKMTYRDDSVKGQCVCLKNKTSKIAAVVGGKSSELSGIMSHLLSTDLIPQISYGAASPTLDKKIYRSFLRTLPKDSYQAIAIADLLRKYNWTYVSVLVSDDDYGRVAISELREQMSKRDMCLAVEHSFDPTFPGNELNKTINEIVSKLHQTNIVILWCDIQPSIRIVKEAYNQGYRNITWIGTESWGNAYDFTSNRYSDMKNLSVIGLNLREQTIKNFTDYINNLSWTSDYVNPWLAPFWEELYYCPLKPKPRPPFCVDLTPTGQILPKYKHYTVIAAVYAVAMGLHSLLGCQAKTKTCSRKHVPIDYALLLQHIKNATFWVPGAERDFHFDKDGNAAFSSYNFRVLIEQPTKTKPNNKKFQHIGQWHGESNILDVDDYRNGWNNTNGVLQIPLALAKGICSQPCPPGSYILRSPIICCWSCYQCPQDTISTNISQSKCEQCSITEVSNQQHTKCIQLQRMNFSFYNIQGQLTITIAMIGVLCVVFVMFTFVKYWETPMVKSSSREMSIIQLTSMLLIFCLPFLHVVEITTPVCMAQVTSLGLFYSHIIAFIAMKTYRLLRVFNRERFTELSKYLQNRYQVLFSFVIVLVELIAIICWYSVPQNRPVPEVFRLKVRSEGGQSKTLSYIDSCGSREDYVIYGVVGYICFLSLVSGYMAFRARSLPENFNEAQFIWFAMFTTCIVWCLFFLLYLSLDRTQKPTVFLCMSLANNFCLLILLYGYKVYIIFYQPHLNTQANFRKMAVNATVTTFYKETDPTGLQRPREQSVISFDFDGMFDEYRKQQQQLPANAGIARRITFRLQKHFPSLRRKKTQSVSKGSPVQKRINRNKHDKARNKTIQIPRNELQSINVMQRSMSYDEVKVKQNREHLDSMTSSSKSTSKLSKRNKKFSHENSTDTTVIEDDIRASFRINSTSLTSLISQNTVNDENTVEQLDDDAFIRNKEPIESKSVNILQMHGITGSETFL